MRPFKPQISFGRAESSRAVPCVGAREHVAVPKMLSRDCPCAFFVRVMHPWKPQISLGRFGSARPGWVGSCRAVPCVGAPAHVAVPKILSCHRPCAFCTFVRPVCSTLPRAFVRVVHPWKAQILFGPCTHGNPKFRSGGSGHVVCGCPCKRIRASRVGSCRAVSGCSGTCGHAKNVKA